MTEKRTISLPDEHALFIDEKLKSGDYASASEVVRAGLRALQARDAAVERWLQEEVAPTYAALQADPDNVRSIDSVFDRVREHHAKGLKGKT